jgi:5,10-methylenetetrahydromethanopterin reductase
MGFAALFVPEIAGRDAFAALTALAGETDRIALGAGVVPISSRRIGVTAMGAATVHERSGGRMVLGLGIGRPRRGALDELEAAVVALRAHVERAVARPLGAEGIVALGSPIPIWLAALGPRTVRLAGRVADGVLLNWCSPDRVAEARSQLAEGAAEAGRDPDEVVVAAYVRAAVGVDGDAAAAREALLRAAGEYASLAAYRRQFDAMGLGGVDAIVDEVCLAGDRAIARRRLDEYRGAGCDLPVVYPVPFGADPAASVAATLHAMAPGEE